jgi:L-amino acid N-acyltransferase YncA
LPAIVDLMTSIRPAIERDHAAIWSIFHGVIAAGDTYALDPGMSREAALAYWFQPGARAYVAERDGRMVGIYHLKPNQAGPGSHVANAAFMVSPEARGNGVGRLMGEHCLAEARTAGFRAIQFNFVVSTNQAAVRLWQQLGFNIVGTLPGAFRHPAHGDVEVYVMFLPLDRNLGPTE